MKPSVIPLSSYLERVNVVKINISRDGAINRYGTLEVHRFNLGYKSSAEESLLISYSTIAYGHYVAGSSGVGKSLEVELVLIFIYQEDMNVFDETSGGFRK